MSILVCFTGVSAAQQLWSGVLSPSRATDWTNAGVVGGIPSGSWTQCGSTIAAYSGTTAAINNAIAACGKNQYVLLGPGTFNLSGGTWGHNGIDFGHKSNVVLRGSGANSTFIVAANNMGAGSTCAGVNSFVCISSNDSTYWMPGTGLNWTAGYTQGGTTVTLSSTSGLDTTKVLVLNQCDDGYSGVNCAGSAVDTGNYFNCGDRYSGGTAGCSISGPDGGNGTPHRFQSELFQISAVNSGVVTLASGLKHPNWRSGQTPQAWYFTPIQNAGIEDMSIDLTNDPTPNFGVVFFNAANVWAKGVRILNTFTAQIQFDDSVHYTVEQSYLFGSSQNGNSGNDSKAIQVTNSCDGLIQNNIIQQVLVGTVEEGSECGSVYAYNFVIKEATVNGVQNQSFRSHANGNDYILREGNIGSNSYGETVHGTALMNTDFRNYYTGWELNSPANYFWTNAYMTDPYARYRNVVGNVLGTPGYHTHYQTTTGNDQFAVYTLGIGNPNMSPPIPSDPLVASTMFRWGNYDVVNGSSQFNNSEVPSGISVYPNSIPGSHTLPPSFYLASKPSWWGSMPWPAIGPDVTGGNLGQCSGGTFSKVAALTTAHCGGSALVGALNGHVNANPAMACYLNVMGGPPDGSGSALPFDANTCYGGSSGGSGNNAPPPPTNLTGTVQ